jgi:SHOCT-like domain
MSIDNERRLILDMIENGKITADEGLGLLNALIDSDGQFSEVEAELLPNGEQDEAAVTAGSSTLPEASVAPETASEKSAVSPPIAERWRTWWQYPLWTGVMVTVLGALLMYWAQQTYGIGFLFLCAWIPLMTGIFLMALAWQSRSERWLHLRVEQPPGDWPRRIAISFPVAPVAWFVRTFKGRITGLQEASVDEFLHALEENTSPDNPLFIEVAEGEHGESVQIFIG